MIIYKINENGRATDFQYSITCPEGYESIDGDKIPDNTDEFNKSTYKKISLKYDLIKERNKRIVEADKWEMPSIQKRFNITQEQVEEYKQTLRDMPSTHTTTARLEAPDWPSELIDEELL